MADMSGLFGPSPYEIEQQRLAQANQNAVDYSRMNATQRGVMGLYQAGGMFGNMGAKAFGGADPAVQNAQASYEAMKSIDTSTPEGLMQYAAKIKEYDPNKATQAVMMARKMQAEAVDQKLKQQKEDRAQQKLEEVDMQRMLNDFEIKKLQLEQAHEIAKMRSEDSRLNSADRLAASREATAARLQLGMLMAEVRKMGLAGKTGEKPLTPAQQMKRDKELAASSAAIRSQDDEILTIGGDIDKVASNEYLGRATGVRGMLPSVPGGKASVIEGELESITNRLKAQGLKVLREGGGIGAITEKEWDILANQVANIDRKRGADYVKSELEKVKLRMTSMQRNAMQRHYEQFGEEYTPSRTGQPQQVPDRTFKVLGKE